eukprot:m51a1_g2507 hypothetical protein (114) ;mRNA; r:141199-141540
MAAEAVETAPMEVEQEQAKPVLGPKRPNRVAKIEWKAPDQDLDVYQLFAVISAVMALILKYRAFAFQSLLFTLIGISTARWSKLDLKNVVMSLSIASLCLTMSYTGPSSAGWS